MITRRYAMKHANFWQDRFHWGTSSVDFCEKNFVVSPYVAEPCNSVSAAPLIGLGLIGCRKCQRTTGNLGFALLFFLLVIVGVGTVMLHATLTAVGQAADEIPMLLLTIGLLACMIDAVNPGKRWLLPVTVIAAVVVIVWYIRFQHMYLVFIFSYGLLVVAIIAQLARWAFIARSDARRDAVRVNVIRPLFLYGLGSYVCAGFVAWCTDMLLCDTVSEVFFGGLFLHPLWHFGSAFGTWCAIYAVIAARDERRGETPRLTWLANILPCVDLNHKVA